MRGEAHAIWSRPLPVLVTWKSFSGGRCWSRPEVASRASSPPARRLKVTYRQGHQTPVRAHHHRKHNRSSKSPTNIVKVTKRWSISPSSHFELRFLVSFLPSPARASAHHPLKASAPEPLPDQTVQHLPICRQNYVMTAQPPSPIPLDPPMPMPMPPRNLRTGSSAASHLTRFWAFMLSRNLIRRQPRVPATLYLRGAGATWIQ